MRNGYYPLFIDGRIVKPEGLSYLRDFPDDLASVALENYSDGVLFGFSISTKEGKVVVSKGALKYKGEIIVVTENAIAMAGYGHWSHVKLVLGECSVTKDFKICPIEVVADSHEAKAENEIELGRFCLNLGAVLRREYDSFSDLRTPENTLDITRVLYAGEGTPTLHPLILKEYAQALMASSDETLDIAFALTCLNSSVVHKRSIQWYIAKKTGSPYQDYSLDDLFDKLVDMLPDQDIRQRPKRPRSKGPAIS
ncbi:MAG: hypothetical protein FWG53_01570 [Clostridiales bacterium]|nr:hypothetical protein [Clostridiales bacterium]